MTGRVLGPHKQIEPSVVVVVFPGCGLTGDGGHDVYSGLHGNIAEGSVAVISQQRMADWRLPCAARHVNIQPAVVVVVSLEDAESPENLRKACRRAPVLEGPVALVMEVMKGFAVISGRDHEIQVAVVVEVVHDDASGHAVNIDSEDRRDIHKSTDETLGSDSLE